MTTVLLVEDDAAIREMMRRRLQLRGFTVLEAADGPEAVAIAAGASPDTVLLDIELPGGMSGWDVVGILRGDARTKGIRVFAITAHVTPNDLERARQVGCNQFFGKPVDFRALVEALGGEPRAVQR
ncbi:MAG TPA: response regulator [Anaeromyxobacter sp.]